MIQLIPRMRQQVTRWAKKALRDVLEDHVDDTTKYGGVYLAVLQNGGYYDVEVEVSPDTIGPVFSGEECGAEGIQDKPTAESIAFEVDAVFARNGIRVYKTREEWKAAAKAVV